MGIISVLFMIFIRVFLHLISYKICHLVSIGKKQGSDFFMVKNFHVLGSIANSKIVF